MNRTLLTLLLTYSCNVLWGQTDIAYFQSISEKLNQVKSASYFWHQSASALYDTIPSISYRVFKKEFIRPEDSLVGAAIASFQPEDTTRMVYFYDGEAQAYLDWDNKTIPADHFQYDRYPFRIIYPPFITYVKSLLHYALITTDEKNIRVYDHTDSVLIRLSVKDKLVEVVGCRIIYADPSSLAEDAWTSYEIWFNKATELPYRLIKRFPDRVCWEECKQLSINTSNTVTFVASSYFPADFELQFPDNKQVSENSMEGKPAPGWKLKDTDNHEISLEDFKSKVLVIQFTGMGCGPCYQSIPYLVQLRNSFKREDFDLLSIETWVTNPSVISKHISKSHINYKYLVGNNQVRSDYGIQSVPKFFVIDKNRVIRKIINGFDKEKTYKELKEVIDHLAIE